MLCNAGIGLVGEDVDVLRTIARNLERARELTQALILSAAMQDELPPLTCAGTGIAMSSKVSLVRASLV
jgi:hypothetical protein